MLRTKGFHLFTSKPASKISLEHLYQTLDTCVRLRDSMPSAQVKQSHEDILKYVSENTAQLNAEMKLWPNTAEDGQRIEPTIIHKIFSSACKMQDPTLLIQLLRRFKSHQDFSVCVAQLICFIVAKDSIASDQAFNHVNIILHNIEFDPNVSFIRSTTVAAAAVRVEVTGNALLDLTSFIVDCCHDSNRVRYPDWDLQILRYTRILKLVLALDKLLLGADNMRDFIRRSDNAHPALCTVIDDKIAESAQAWERNKALSAEREQQEQLKRAALRAAKQQEDEQKAEVERIIQNQLGIYPLLLAEKNNPLSFFSRLPDDVHPMLIDYVCAGSLADLNVNQLARLKKHT